MMDATDFRSRLDLAHNRRCPFHFVRDYFGLDLAGDVSLGRDYEFWARQRKIPDALAGETVDRWWLETFLQTRQLTPVKWMALQLGMKQVSLERLLQQMRDTGPQLAYHLSPSLIGNQFEEDLLGVLDLFPSAPGDHDESCRIVHQRVRELFGLCVEPEYCVTSQRIGRQPPEFAKFVDILTYEPVGPRYQVWLNFGKWIALAPDRCSSLTFAIHHDALGPFAASRESSLVPPEIEVLVAEAAH